jgi:GT2 family glycosyltransferase
LVLNRNGKEWLPVICESLRKQDYPRTRIYVVDNGSDDGSVELVLKRFPEVKVIRMPQNLGYCMAYNLAMPYAFAEGCEWVIWANNDIRLEPGCLSELIRVALDEPRTGVVGPSFLTWEGEEPNDYMVGNHPHALPAMRRGSKDPIDVEWVEGSFLMVSRPCVESVGPLDPFLYFYWEETDFCRRARKQGWRVLLAPAALARHYAGGWSAGNARNADTANRLKTRNSYIYQLADPFRMFPVNLLAALHLLLIHVREALPGNPGFARFHLGAFAGVLREIPAIHRKWARDRSGGHPAPVKSDVCVEGIQVLGLTRGTVREGTLS